jgi:DNA-binding transcriptional MerR regulator
MKAARKEIYSYQSNSFKQSLKIGEVAELSGIGIEALRFYERSGLIGTPARAVNGYRMYHPSVINRLEFIKKAQVLGFSLDEIRTIIKESKSGESPCEEVREIVRVRLKEMSEQMRRMRRYHRELTAALADWDEQGTTEGDICGFIENSMLEAEPADVARALTGKSSRKKK